MSGRSTFLYLDLDAWVVSGSVCQNGSHARAVRESSLAGGASGEQGRR